MFRSQKTVFGGSTTSPSLCATPFSCTQARSRIARAKKHNARARRRQCNARARRALHEQNNTMREGVITMHEPVAHCASTPIQCASPSCIARAEEHNARGRPHILHADRCGFRARPRPGSQARAMGRRAPPMREPGVLFHESAALAPTWRFFLTSWCRPALVPLDCLPCCSFTVGNDQVSTVGLRHPEVEVDLVSFLELGVGSDQISTVGLRHEYNEDGSHPVERERRKWTRSVTGWDCDIVLVWYTPFCTWSCRKDQISRVGLRQNAVTPFFVSTKIQPRSEVTRSVQWDCDGMQVETLTGSDQISTAGL
jgi:hypothetical protein